MDPKIKVSVVIPVYNVKNYLHDCLDSLLHQTLTDLEIICVDDGSTDGSAQILDEYARIDPRIIVIHQKNAGAGAARNNGIRAARGHYIGFVDSDDIVLPNMYELLYQKAISCDADMVITGQVNTAVGDPIQFPLENFKFTARALELDSFKAVDFPDILRNVFLWNRIYSREFWLNHHLIIPEGRRFAEDILICTQTSVLAERIGYVKGPLYWYRNAREDSLSDTLAKSSRKLDYIVALKETKDFLINTNKYVVYQEDFLIFVTHIFSMLQKTIANYTHFHEFFQGMCEVLDQEDLDLLETTWLQHSYPHVLRALRKQRFLSLYIRNRIYTILHLN